MGEMKSPGGQWGKWLALSAALLGWMFDGLEMGLFSLVGRQALRGLLPGESEATIGQWFAVAMAVFLVGAATGGVLFGWLGDRIGRVRAMSLSVLTYAVCTGLQGLATSAEQIAVLRFLAALGMGGEWSLGVALVTEIWPDRSRAFLAGLIGAASNVGFLLIAVLGLGLVSLLGETRDVLLAIHLPENWVDHLLAGSGWRLLMILGAVPALLCFFIQVFVPESERWQREHHRGATSHWATRDLLGVVVGALGACGFIYLWAEDFSLPVRLFGSALGLVVTTLGYVYPVVRYLQRSGSASYGTSHAWRPTLWRMLLGAGLSGVALLGTWGSIQWAPSWADKLTHEAPGAKEYTQIWSAVGAIVGTIVAAHVGEWIGRRLTYCLLCLGSLGASLVFFQLTQGYDGFFLAAVFLAGGLTASFYGWLPLYLPELFRTGVRATGQGFSFNFGRIVAAVGVLQTGFLMKQVFKDDYAQACSLMSLIYLVGVAIIWLAPETKGKPLPE
jgi:MFS family permease